MTLQPQVFRPRIGLTPDLDERAAPETGYSVRRNYADAVQAAGGVPLILPYIDRADDHLELLDALVVTGGMFDIDPSLYGADPIAHLKTKPVRTAFERDLIRGALVRRMPILGICNGMQLLAVLMGGKLMQHIPTEVDAALEHMAEAYAYEPLHPVSIVPGSQLSRFVDRSEGAVNSVHHQAVLASDAYGTGAYAPDGVIEAIEVPGQPFCIGLQWHPEYHASELDRSIWAAFVASASEFAKTKRNA